MEKKYQHEILSGLDETAEDLFQTITLFNQEEFNEIPFEGSWTAGQVADHIFKSETGLPAVLNGNSKTTERQPDEKVAKIKSIFLDYNLKMKSPDSVLPSNEKQDKEQISTALKVNREKIIGLANSLDLEKTYYDFPFPGLGEFTGIEWLTFAICHTKRHIHQMKNIHDKMK
ncbi:MAG: DinB family protein [Ginsengibacter sp.]